MATLTQPENTGTLNRDEVLAAAGATTTARPDVPRPISPEELDRQAAELRAWLDAHGTAEAARTAEARTIDLTSLDRPGLLVHPHLWLPTPARWEPTPARGLDVLLDEAFAPVHAVADAFAPPSPAWLDVLLDGPQDERERVLGWSLVVGLWAVATALFVPLVIWATIGTFDMTIDLSGDEGVAEASATAPAAVDTTTTR